MNFYETNGRALTDKPDFGHGLGVMLNLRIIRPTNPPLTALVALILVTASFLPARAQVSFSSQPAPADNTITTYKQALAALAAERQALVTNNATPEQIQAWAQQNAAQLQALRASIQAVSPAAGALTPPANPQPRLPAGASPTLQAFLTSQVQLAAANQALSQQPSSGLSGSAVQAQISAALELQAQRAQTLASAPGPGLQPSNSALFLPANTPPQVAAFLTTRFQLAQGRAQVASQYASATPAERDAAMQAWRQQNAALFEQLQQEAQALAEPGGSANN